MEPGYLLPRAPTASAALSRAAEGAERRSVPLRTARDGSPIDEERYADVRFPSTGRGNKQAVTVILDPDRRRLSYEPFASVWVEDGRLRVESLLEGARPLDAETDALEDLRSGFAFEKNRHDGEAVRRVMVRALGSARAIPLRNSGAMYFVNREHHGEAENILAFVAAVASTAGSAPARTARTPRAMTVPLVDREEYREVIAESLEDFVQKEARSLVEEMASLTRGQERRGQEAGRKHPGPREGAQGLRRGVRGAPGDPLHRGPCQPGGRLEAGPGAARPRLGRLSDRNRRRRFPHAQRLGKARHDLLRSLGPRRRPGPPPSRRDRRRARGGQEARGRAS